MGIGTDKKRWKMRRSSKLLLITMCMALSVVLLPVAATASEVNFVPDPSSALAGETTNVSIWLDSTEGVFSFDAELHFDPTVVNITDASVGDFPTGFGMGHYGNYVILGGVTSDFNDKPAGHWLLANLTLEAKNAGTSPLNFNPSKTYPGNQTGKRVPATWNNGTFTCTGPPAPQPDWHQFQKDEVNTGITNESAPVDNAAKAWKQFTHSASGMAAGIVVAPIVADGKVFVIDAKGYAWAFDAKSGEEIWNQSLSCEGGQFQLATPAYADGKVFISTNDGHVYALNPATGAVLWNNKIAETYDQLGTPVTYAVADGKIYVGSIKSDNGANDAGVYYCLNSNGNLVWNRTSTTGKGYYWSGSAVVGDYLVYGDLASVLTSVYRDNGTLADEINITTDVPFNRSDAGAIKSSITYNDSFIYFTSEGGYVWQVGFDESSGEFTADGWSKKIETSTSTPAVHEGRVYVGSGSWSVAGKLYCLNASDGGEEWNFEPNGGIKASPAISVQGDDSYIYFTTNCANSRVYCVDENGNEMWNFTTEEAGTSGGYILQGVAISDGYVYFGNDGGYVYGLKEAPVLDWEQFHYDIANTGNSPSEAPDDNTTKWISDNIGAVASSQAMIVDDKVFVYGNDHVVALSRASGTELWNTSIPGDTQGWGSWASPAYDDDDLLFVSAGYNLTKLNATTGVKIQEFAFPDGGYTCNGGPTIADGMVFAGSGGSNYYAFDKNDLNTVLWNYTVAGGANSVPAVADGKVVFGELTWSGASDLYCVDESTGDWIWNTTLAGAVGGSAAIDAANNRVYVATFVDYGSNTGKLYALAFDTGVIQWSADITYTDSTPAIAGSYIYVSGSTNAPGVTYCFDSAGVEQWNVSCGSWTMSPAVADGKLFTGKVGIWGAKGISAFDSTTGAPIWSYADAGSSPSVSEGMAVSIGSDGKVYAFEEETGVLELTAITVTPSTATLNITETQQFSATAKDQFGNPMTGIVFAWSSSNETVGTVNDTGFFIALATGTAMVNATNGTIVGTAEVTVEEVVSQIFDTGAPANPYPSIAGTHNGTITPNKTIDVNKMFTYPCTGTGGHTEFAMIWNDGTTGDCAVANWNGYIGDWHNISFNRTLTLQEGVVYNYTIRTGSYPQIHHTDALPTENGWINCTKFTDANGKSDDKWIPAIKLFYEE